MHNFSRYPCIIVCSLLLGGCGGSTESADSPSQPPQTEPVEVSTTLEWEIPTMRLDGSHLSVNDLSGYKLFMGSSANTLTLAATIDDPQQTSYTFTELSEGTYFFSVAVIDRNGLESEPAAIIRREL